MISGILTALTILASSPNEPELRDWLQALADAAPTELTFVETRASSLLAAPLEVRGRLARDGERLVRRTDTPRRETQILSASAVELRREDGYRQRFALRRAPELAALREALLAILDGDANRLATHFRVGLEFDDEGSWQMQLEPRSEDLAARVGSLVIAGTDLAIIRLELTLDDGEQIVTRFDTDS